MELSPLDEYPIHQAPAPITRPATSDRNFYDRSYFNVLDREGRFMALTGIGIRSNTWLRFLFRRTAAGLPQIATLPAQAPLEA